jgi:hypothetical protein
MGTHSKSQRYHASCELRQEGSSNWLYRISSKHRCARSSYKHMWGFPFAFTLRNHRGAFGLASCIPVLFRTAGRERSIQIYIPFSSSFLDFLPIAVPPRTHTRTRTRGIVLHYARVLHTTQSDCFGVAWLGTSRVFALLGPTKAHRGIPRVVP